MGGTKAGNGRKNGERDKRVRVRAGVNGTNYVKNPGFESGTTSWDLQGCHLRSSVEDNGYQGGKAMHLRCSDRIWTGANSVQGSLNSNPFADGKVATLRLKARWLRGWPEVLLRLNGSYLETTGAMPLPLNLGSPGLPNSTAVNNAGPAVYEVTHTPTLPPLRHPRTHTYPLSLSLTHTQPYSMRVSIDLDLRIGSWYIVSNVHLTESCTVIWQKDLLELCEPTVLAFDIECEKSRT